MRKLTTKTDSNFGQKTIDKAHIKKVVKSLKTVNRRILKNNGIDEMVDDFIYLTIKMEQPIRPFAKLGEKTKDVKTSVQMVLPNPLKVEKALLLVKKGNQERVQSIVC